MNDKQLADANWLTDKTRFDDPDDVAISYLFRPHSTSAETDIVMFFGIGRGVKPVGEEWEHIRLPWWQRLWWWITGRFCYVTREKQPTRKPTKQRMRDLLDFVAGSLITGFLAAAIVWYVLAFILSFFA